MPLSSDPGARERQLGNLVPGGGQAGPGNVRARRHGGFARVAVERREEHVQLIYAALAEDAPLKERGELPAADQAVVLVAAETLARLEDVREFLTTYGIADEKSKQLRPAVLVEQKLRRELVGYLGELGMSTRSRARLGVDVRTIEHLDLATVLSAARDEQDPELRRAMYARAGLLDDDDGTEGAGVDG